MNIFHCFLENYVKKKLQNNWQIYKLFKKMIIVAALERMTLLSDSETYAISKVLMRKEEYSRFGFDFFHNTGVI